jgi:hypothetical protein
MSQYEFTKKSYIDGSDGKDLPITYSFDVDEDGAVLYSAIVGGLDLISWIDDGERDSLETECLERMAADRADNAMYAAEAAESHGDWKREWESNYER